MKKLASDNDVKTYILWPNQIANPARFVTVQESSFALPGMNTAA
jgi:hypothetical protein